MTDRAGASLEGLEDLQRLGRAYKAAGKDLRKSVRTALLEVARPLATDVVREGAEALPARGGLRARVAASRGTVSSSLASRHVSVAIRLSNRQKDSLTAMDRGELRHPVFDTSRWVSQRIPAGGFTRAFDQGAPEVRDRVRLAVDSLLHDIAGRVNRI